MACSLRSRTYVSGMNGTMISSKSKGEISFYNSSVSSQPKESKSIHFPALSIDFLGKPMVISDQIDSKDWSTRAASNFSVNASICVSRAVRWWEKTHKPNMIEIHSAEELVDSLLNAGDRLVIVDFYSPGCGGCKALHPKICQLAESNPNAIFLNVNYEELRTTCHILHIHVLPFFRFYRGAEGRLCSFSCTNATIKKFKDALAKHGSDRCSLGPAKGLDETELIKLASAGELWIKSPLPSRNEQLMKNLFIQSIDFSGVLNQAGEKTEFKEENAVL